MRQVLLAESEDRPALSLAKLQRVTRFLIAFALVAGVLSIVSGSGIQAASTATTYRDEVLADSPRAYWRLGETSGSTATDELGAHPGTYVNGVLVNQPGALSSETDPSASFDGVNDYVTVPGSSSLDMTSAVTVEFWAKRRAISSTYQVLVGKPGNGQSKYENYAVWLNTSNRYQAYFGDGTTYVSVQTSAVTDTNWHHVVATDDGSSARIYLDGVQKASTSTTLRLTANTNPLNFGRASSNQYFFNGWLDEMAIYPTALSATRIQAHYTKGTTDLIPPSVTLAQPADGASLASSSVTSSGTAGSSPGDSSTVMVKVYSGTSATGTPAQTLTAIRQPDNSYSVSATLVDGTWTAQSEQQDSAGNIGKSSANTFTVATVGPVATISSGPPDPSNQTTATFNFSADKPASFQCSLDGAAFATCSGPKTYSGLADGSHTFQVKATDPAGNTSTASYTWTVDTVSPPIPAITSNPPSQTVSTSASFGFSDAESGVTLRCQLDGGGFSSCTSPQVYSGLASGVHTFEVKARDAAGNESAPASYTWTIVGTAPPTPTFDATPSDPSSSTTATFSFSDTQPGVSFECSLDGASYDACISPASLSGLAQGSHTFRVRARDSGGNLSASQSYTWTVDTTAPSESITSKPPNPSDSTSPSFSFSADESVTFECSLDGDVYAACTSPKTYSGVPDGSHTFRLRATDPAGNVSTASYTWTIDTTAPSTTITSKPPNPSNSTSPSFSFSADEPATFQCSLDGATFASCMSPKSYSGLTDGSHTFRVRATDQAGNTGLPTSYAWTVDGNPPPAPTISSNPANPTTSTSATFVFSDAEANVTLLCQLDGGGFSTCTSPKSYSGLADGSHTFDVKARDSISNESAPTSYTWTVDTTPPITTLFSTPSNPSNQTTATFGFVASELSSFQCKLDGGAFVACSSPQTYFALAGGSHTFQVKATDQAGNTGAPASYTWTVDTTPPGITLTSPANGDTRAEWPTFKGRAGTAAGDASTVTVKVYSGPSPSGSLLQTLTATVGAGGDYAVAASFPLSPGTYTAQAQQSDSAGNTGSSSANTFTVGDPVIFAAGSIASCYDSGAGRVAAAVLSTVPDALLQTLGNHAYENGQPSEFACGYDPTYGVAKARTYPAVGNHDMYTVSGGPPAGTGFHNEFDAQLAKLGPTASDPTKVYYSYDLGAWHIVVLNDTCLVSGRGGTPGCDEAAQEQWLRNDLSTHPNYCVLGIVNRPRWSSDNNQGRTDHGVYWDIFYQYGVDLVLSGAGHHYERFAPMDPSANFDPTYGIRQIISGHGGYGSNPIVALMANSEVYDNTSYGALKLTLHSGSYDWQFMPIADGVDPGGGSFTDSGSNNCHAAPPPSQLSYHEQVLAASPAAYWRLGETSGTSAADETGTNPGTYNNVTLGAPGALSSDSDPSASFDGVRSYVRAPASPSLNMTSAVTVELWAKRRTISSTYQVLVGKPGIGVTKSENYAVWLNTSNRYQAYFGDGSTFVAVVTPAITDTNWHHVVATYNGSRARIYLDGVLKQEIPQTLQMRDNNLPLNIGRANNGSYFFNGWLDEVAVYPTALPAQTILAHYNRATGSP
jgi:hypothetical protein